MRFLLIDAKTNEDLTVIEAKDPEEAISKALNQLGYTLLKLMD
jgi:hypothetical protein